MYVFVLWPSQRGRLGSGGSDNFLATVSYPGKGCAPWHPFGLVVVRISRVGGRFAGVEACGRGELGGEGAVCYCASALLWWASVQHEPGEVALMWIALSLPCLPLGPFIKPSVPTPAGGQETFGLSALASPRRQPAGCKAGGQGVMDGVGGWTDGRVAGGRRGAGSGGRRGGRVGVTRSPSRRRGPPHSQGA